ncbi:peptidase C14 [Dendrothele bispora CBS 962.96]|uniref:Peptidase C14 n=1 Tax=Dendrothele bispora (strain CBS 962.96) TaxID=1314807 RepID=A0A4S8LI95_DENBC|nr:peptidase C14 [Dendrothele bispora CBS 962.96]
MVYDEPQYEKVHRVERTTVSTQEWVTSDCTGQKKALLIGINYVGSDNALEGCHSDVDRMYRFLVENYGLDERNICVLKDSESLSEKYWPTRDNIISWMRWLVTDIEPNDSIFFHYSGHGGQRRDVDGDEKDYYDECIYPVDSLTSEDASEEESALAERKVLDDDILHRILVSSLPKGARLTAIFDSCHSGSVLDLPFVYSAASGDLKEGRRLEYEDREERGGGWGRRARGILGLEKKEVFEVREDVFRVGDMLEATKNILEETGKKLFVEKDSEGALEDIGRLQGVKAHVEKVEEMQRRNESLADVVLISGCKDTQTSADANEDGVPTGALSWALMESLRENSEPTYFELLNSIRSKLRKERYAQLPQLSSGHPMDLSTVFIA